MARLRSIAISSLVAACLAAGLAGSAGAGSQSFDLEGHRGARGLRPENTLSSFAKALQTGVTTLELDAGITQDKAVVVSHDRYVSPLVCTDTHPVRPGDPEYPYVGDLISELTLRQIKTVDCGARTHSDFAATQVLMPGSRIPTLQEVFDLADRYEAREVRFNIETKIDPTQPGETVGPREFARRVLRVVDENEVMGRSMLQSFDWRTLVAAYRLHPALRLVALGDESTIQLGVPGESPWTAGIDIDEPPFKGDVAKAARSIGAKVLSVDHLFLTDDMIASAHARNMLVVPWTVDDKPTMRDLIDRDVDGIITDYPNRLRQVLAARDIALPQAHEPPPFDVEGHRGARWYRPENTLPAFRYALRAGVDTLELDTGVTQDGVLVVLHDRLINGVHCEDTAPATPGDPEYPYVGDLVKDLTLAQIKTLDCGNTDPAFPEQVARPGARIPTLQEVFDLVEARGDNDVRFNIETKISPLVDDTVPYKTLTRKLVSAIERNNLTDRAMIQSFDWRTIIYAHRLNPSIDTVALIWQFAGEDCDALSDECSLEAVVGDPSVESPWTGGLDWWDFRNVGRLVRAAHADVVSSNWQVHDPYQAHVESEDFYAKEDPDIFHGPRIPRLHEQGLLVVPYTIDDEATMQRLIDLGVDGIISDNVDLLIEVARRNGL
ncbi:MAG: glycerophosphodiester phosphodiesterase family protein [Actinomycetota bacterium]